MVPFCVWAQNLFGHLMSFQQESSHFCNQNTFNLQDWLTFIACWSLIKIFCQNTLWKKYLLISKQQEDKEKTCFLQRWDVIQKQKCKMAKIHNKNAWQFNSFLDQLHWQYLCFAKQFRSLVILKMIDDIIFLKLSSTLETLAYI